MKREATEGGKRAHLYANTGNVRRYIEQSDKGGGIKGRGIFFIRGSRRRKGALRISIRVERRKGRGTA